MSYDYNALVGRINKGRRQVCEAEGDERIAPLQETVDSFSELSTKCPMTPLLWMQYAADTAELLNSLTQDATAALETRLQMLELSLSEFPGSAILQLHYLEFLCSAEYKGDSDKVEKALESAMDQVGGGSHRNEGPLIVSIYRMAAEFHASKRKDMNHAIDIFCRRARTPMKDSNDTITSEIQEFCQRHGHPASSETLQRLDQERRYESRVYSGLAGSEDEVDVAMHSEGILPRHQIDLVELPWGSILHSDGKTFWMGLGGVTTADAYIKYAQACYRHKMSILGDDDESKEESRKADIAIKALALAVYERGVAECPTVESLWLSYIRHLQFCVQGNDALLGRLASVVDRSVRNCPYSLTLYRHKLNTQQTLADRGVSVLDPDALTKIVNEAIESKFIASKESCLDLHMTSIEVIRRRILTLLANAWSSEQPTVALDDAVQMKPNAASPDLNEKSTQELEDLCDDLREYYDGADSYLRKNYSGWSAGRARLWADRAFTEANLLVPLGVFFTDDASTNEIGQREGDKEMLRVYEKLTKVHQPAHPDTYNNYIKSFLGTTQAKKASGLMAKFHHARFLFQKGLKSVGKPKHESPPLDSLIERDFDTALRDLCHDYLVFERHMGSERSVATATKAIQKKLAKFSPQTVHPPTQPVEQTVVMSRPQNSHMEVDSSTPVSEKPVDEIQSEHNDLKRPHEVEDGEPHRKRTKLEAGDAGIDGETDRSSTPQQQRGHPPKVKVGNLEYPSHPFTVRVSNLLPATEDMELVDTFRPKCGAIVHAKVIREKHHHGKGKSKGWGLIQFEEQDSVDKALELSDVIGIRERLVKVGRSHMPAVGLVPPGMHRVNPKGEGKSSKRNQKRKEQRVGGKTEVTQAGEPVAAVSQAKPKEKGGNSADLGVLAFRPRGVQQSRNHRKVKIAFSPSTGEQKTGDS